MQPSILTCASSANTRGTNLASSAIAPRNGSCLPVLGFCGSRSSYRHLGRRLGIYCPLQTNPPEGNRRNSSQPSPIAVPVRINMSWKLAEWRWREQAPLRERSLWKIWDVNDLSAPPSRSISSIASLDSVPATPQLPTDFLDSRDWNHLAIDQKFERSTAGKSKPRHA